MTLIYPQFRIFKVCLYLIFFFCSLSTFAQNEVIEQAPEKKELGANEIHSMVEKRPEFPGGVQAFYDFIGKNYRVPKVNLKGKVFVQFVIERDGSLTDIKVLRDIGYGTGKEAIRVLKKSPKWIPGEVNGEVVRVQYSLPINIEPN